MLSFKQIGGSGKNTVLIFLEFVEQIRLRRYTNIGGYRS